MGFATFGAPHLLQLLIEVSGRAGRAVWWQKWGVHRRLRPEEYGGRIDNHRNGRRTYPLDTSILNSLGTGLLSAYFPKVDTVLSRGEVIVSGDQYHGRAGHGQFVRRGLSDYLL